MSVRTALQFLGARDRRFKSSRSDQFLVRLLHFCQHHKLGQPRYELVETTGLQHEQQFRVLARLTDGRNDEGLGRTKRAAEKVAASRLLDKLSADRAG
jgi:dsRNA-specific ribonuclease